MNGGCSSDKALLLHALQGGDNAADWIALLISELVLLGVTAWGGWLVILLRGRYSYIVYAAGLVAAVLAAIDFGYSAYEPWEAKFDAAGCCCCYNTNTSACDLSAASCNSTITGCYSHDGLLAHGVSSVDRLMPEHDNGSSWMRRAVATLVLTVVGFFLFAADLLRQQPAQTPVPAYAPVLRKASASLAF